MIKKLKHKRKYIISPEELKKSNRNFSKVFYKGDIKQKELDTIKGWFVTQSQLPLDEWFVVNSGREKGGKK